MNRTSSLVALGALLAALFAIRPVSAYHGFGGGGGFRGGGGGGFRGGGGYGAAASAAVMVAAGCNRSAGRPHSAPPVHTAATAEA